MEAAHPDIALTSYLGGELDAQERANVEGHLEGCARCRGELESSSAALRELAHRIEALPTPDWTRYRYSLRRRMASRREVVGDRRWRPAYAWASIASASVAVAALALVLTLRPGGGVAEPPVDQLALQDAMAGADVGLLKDYPVVARLDLLQDYDVIEHLDQLAPGNDSPS